MSDWHEKRAEPRLGVAEHRWQVLHAEDGQALGVLANLSANGLMLNSEQPLPEQSTYQVRLSWQDGQGQHHELALGIHVLWCSPGPGGGHWAGCEIISISDADQETLLALLGD